MSGQQPGTCPPRPLRLWGLRHRRGAVPSSLPPSCPGGPVRMEPSELGVAVPHLFRAKIDHLHAAILTASFGAIIRCDGLALAEPSCQQALWGECELLDQVPPHALRPFQ